MLLEYYTKVNSYRYFWISYLLWLDCLSSDFMPSHLESLCIKGLQETVSEIELLHSMRLFFENIKKFKVVTYNILASFFSFSLSDCQFGRNKF